MSTIKVLDKCFVPFLTNAEIETRIQQLAVDISRDYKDKNPLFIGILNGAFMFAAELFKHLDITAEISFIKLASYKGTTSAGTVITAIGLENIILERNIIILEDIVDTGKTLSAFLPQLQAQQPASITVATLLHKPEATKYPIHPHYIGFSIPDKFVVGYGLDYDGYGRNLKAIYQLKEEHPQ